MDGNITPSYRAYQSRHWKSAVQLQTAHIRAPQNRTGLIIIIIIIIIIIMIIIMRVNREKNAGWGRKDFF